jgi:hypothetical protein
MSRKAKNRKGKHQSKLSKILSTSRSDRSALTKYFQNLSPIEMVDSFTKVSRHIYFIRATELTKKRCFSDTYQFLVPPSELEKSIAWCLSIIIHHKNIIQSHITLRKELSKAVLNFDYLSSVRILDEIDDKCGLSIWSVAARASIENRITELNSVGDTLQSLINEVDDGLLSYIIKYSSDYYNEHDIFFTSIDTHIFDLDKSAPSRVKDFVVYKLFGIDFERSYDFEQLFNFEKNSSIIDIYNLIINYISYVVSNSNNKPNSYSLFYRVISDLNNNIQCDVIQGFANHYGIESPWTTDNDTIRLVDLYTKGEYKRVCDIANEKGLSAFDFSVFELIVKSNVRVRALNQNDSLYYLVPHIENTITKNELFNSSIQFLACEAFSFRSIDWFLKLSYFVKRESPFIASEARKNYDNLILINSSAYTPKFLNVISNELKDKYLRFLLESYNNSASVHLYNALSSNLEIELSSLQIESERKSKYYSLYLLNAKQYDKAVQKFGELTKSDDIIIAIESSILLVDAMMLSGKTLEVIDTFVSISLSNKNLLSMFDTHRILKVSEKITKNNKSINIPIAYSLHSRFSDSIYDSNLKYSFETFLKTNNAQFPTDLFGLESVYGKDELHYFLKWICTPEVMKLYFEFESLRQTEECRLKICNYLMENGDDDEALRNEVKEINRAHIIRRAVKKVENSRIYVDTSNLTGRDSEKYRSLFEKYIELSGNNYNEEEDEIQFLSFMQHLKNDLSLNGLDYWKGLSIIHFQGLRLNAKNSTFLSLAKLIRSEFTYGDRGLNNYLSTRIRHGVLPTALRKPIVEEGLYVSDNLELEDFKKDSRWYNETRTFTGYEIDNVWKILKDFSQSYEQFISDLNDERLQIYILEEALNKSSEKSTKKVAMFDYSISPLECFALQKELSISPNYNDFVRVATQWLWDKTDYNLKIIQDHIRTEFRNKVVDLLDDLKDSVAESCFSEGPISDFYNTVDRLKSSLSSQIELICSWFSHVDADESEEYEIETTIDIAKRSLNLQIDLESRVICLLSERSLSYMVDVFFILFENAISKSKLPKHQLSIKVLICKNDEGQVVINTTNNCLIDGSLDEHNKKIQFYKDAYGNEALIKGVLQKEGGTGFFKIWKILEKDLEISHSIDLEFTENDTFSVDLILNRSKSLYLK